MAKSNLSTGEQLESIWKLGGLRPMQLGKIVMRGVNEDNLLGRAAELAYNLILALFPLMIFLISLLGLFAQRGAALRQDLLSYVAALLPPGAFDIFNRTVNEVVRNTGGGKLTFGILLTLWFASGGMTSMISALNGAYRVKETRSVVKVRGIAVALTVVISVLIVIALVVVLAGGDIAQTVGDHFGLGRTTVIAWRIVQWILVLFFLVTSFSLIYYFGPDVKEQHWYWITPGSIFGVALWLVASFAFRTYLHFFNTYSRTYGSLGAVMILLIWLYVTGLAFMIGGEINADIEHAAAMRGHPEAKAPGEKKAA